MAVELYNNDAQINPLPVACGKKNVIINVQAPRAGFVVIFCRRHCKATLYGQQIADYKEEHDRGWRMEPPPPQYPLTRRLVWVLARDLQPPPSPPPPPPPPPDGTRRVQAVVTG